MRFSSFRPFFVAFLRSLPFYYNIFLLLDCFSAFEYIDPITIWNEKFIMSIKFDHDASCIDFFQAFFWFASTHWFCRRRESILTKRPNMRNPYNTRKCYCGSPLIAPITHIILLIVFKIILCMQNMKMQTCNWKKVQRRCALWTIWTAIIWNG